VKYGDCKDKATLLRAMLEEIGVESHLATVYAHNGFPRPFGPTTIAGNFNHAILRMELPEGPVYVDPTARTVPFGELPAAIQGAWVLPVTPDGHALEQLPWSSPDENRRHVALDLELRDDGMVGTYETTLDGTQAHAGRHEMHEHTSARYPKRFRRVLSLHTSDDARTVEIVSPGTAVEPQAFVFHGKLQIPSTFIESPQRRLLRARNLVDTYGRKVPKEPRRNPFVLGTPETLEHEIRIAVPAGWTVTNLPEPVSFESDFARYSLEWFLGDDGALHMKRTVVDIAPIVSASAE